MWSNRTNSTISIATSLIMALSPYTPEAIRNDKEDIDVNYKVINTVDSQNRWGERISSNLCFQPKGLQKIFDRIDAIAALEENWDGEGASAFSSRLINRIKTLVLELTSQPQVFPTACNSIQLEFDGIKGSYLEFEVDESEQVGVFMIDRDGEEHDYNIQFHTQELNKIVGLFYG